MTARVGGAVASAGTVIALICAFASCKGRNEPPGFEAGEIVLAVEPRDYSQAVGADVAITGTVSLVGAGAETDFTKGQSLWAQVENPTVLSIPNDLSLVSSPQAPFFSPNEWIFYLARAETRPFTMTLRCLAPGTTIVYFASQSLAAGTLDSRPGNGGGATVTCTAPPTTRKPREFANGVADLLIVQRSGSVFALPTTSHGVTANLGERAPELAQKFTAIGEHCERYEGAATFPSVMGPSTVTAKTASQNALATYDAAGRTYQWSGLASGPDVFAPSGSLTVDFAKADGTPESIAVTAPAAFEAAPAELSEPKGFDTEFRVTEADAQHILLFGQMSPTGAGFTCDYLTKDLPLVNGARVVPVVPTEVRQAIPGLGQQLSMLYVAKSNAATTTTLFPLAGERDVHAARMLRINPAFLNP